MQQEPLLGTECVVILQTGDVIIGRKESLILHLSDKFEPLGDDRLSIAKKRKFYQFCE